MADPGGPAAPDFVAVATENDFWDGEMATFDIDGLAVLLLRIDGEYHAYQDRCPHQAQSLGDGDLDGAVLVCAAHLWEFDARTGQGRNPRAACLVRHEVRVADATVFVSRAPSGDPVGAHRTHPPT